MAFRQIKNGTNISTYDLVQDDELNTVSSDLNTVSSELNDVTFITKGDKFVAVAQGSFVPSKAAYSTDGITWTASAMPGFRSWQSVTYGAFQSEKTITL